ncbi:succinate--hydroxymethylglutarate CoA-transferase isoform X2 [Nothobranchius furzeri]|uniref:succinate--hydroxymethylglutarate CoA-transferase isoform X2 n=1 Tax=Nothobranchius furzeri TaxID=105023 RepID=UPI003904CEA3
MLASLRTVCRRFGARCLFGFRPLLQRKEPLKSPGSRRWKSDPNTASLRPLEGVRVLDLTRVLAGPFATMILGDLGAEVIKVERPGGGDDTRTWGPPFIGSESVYFLSVNRNKKSLAVDLKHPRGAAIIQELAGVCDVLVENFLPGKLDQMSLGFEDVSRQNPGLIYCSISGYGQTGPLSQSPGYDSIVSAMSGMMHITGPEDGEPVRPGVAMTDLATGLYAHGAIMAALLQRLKTGRGLHIDCNLLSSQLVLPSQQRRTASAPCARRCFDKSLVFPFSWHRSSCISERSGLRVSCLSHIAANYLNAGQEAQRWGTAHESIVPYQRILDGSGVCPVSGLQNQRWTHRCRCRERPTVCACVSGSGTDGAHRRAEVQNQQAQSPEPQTAAARSVPEVPAGEHR